MYKEWDGITMGLTIGIFTPIIDGSFLDEKPAVSLKRKEFKKTNILMGANKDEGMFFIFYYMADLFPKEEDVFINREDFERSITELNVYANPLQRKAIEFEYTNWLNPGDPIKNREEVSPHTFELIVTGGGEFGHCHLKGSFVSWDHYGQVIILSSVKYNQDMTIPSSMIKI